MFSPLIVKFLDYESRIVHQSIYLFKYFINFFLQLCFSLDTFVPSKPDYLLFTVFNPTKISVSGTQASSLNSVQLCLSSSLIQISHLFQEAIPDCLGGCGIASLWTLIPPYQNLCKALQAFYLTT